ncbi:MULTISPECIES: hypothetical protein [Helicobacter]|uniref:DUF3139 domain-containing protein n=1 Tax=Helicobacter ibis TaxID=2962633 RepID=A0ABT4VES8_9HELI|nr:MULTISPECIES: hypothetical protein [Helicobacter]MDA3967069.1 hypothetical protein [Helicobacter sp. WB40]MDA3969203.1 hypothetical protein [Helicobacter ibis]
MRAFVLLPFLFFILLGGMLIALTLKFEMYGKHEDSSFFALYFVSFKERIKDSISNNKIYFENGYAFVSYNVEQYRYKAVILEFDSKLVDKSVYLVDIFGEDINTLESSRREDFIFSP